jgi:hypothetical protein
MTIETFLTIASFAISVGGFIVIYLYEYPRKKWIAIGVVIALLSSTTGYTLYQSYQHNRLIDQVEKEIIITMSHKNLTFDQLYAELPFVPFQVLNEALFGAIERGVIGQSVSVVRINDGPMQQVRVYFVVSYQQ